jgi:hypothetical protein
MKKIGYTALGVLLLLAAAFIIWQASARVKAFYYINYGSDAFQSLFYDGLGTSQNLAAVLSTILSFFYAASLIGVATWTVLLFRTFNARQFVVGLVCFVVVYAAAPLLHVLNDQAGSLVCFNQTTGTPMKWYAEEINGHVTLYDSGGYDTVRGVEKHPVTAEVCSNYARQKNGAAPHRITTNVRQIAFFDANSGRAQIWYSKSPDGSYELFDSRGFNPSTGEMLQPVTKEILADITARAAKAEKDSEDARKRIEETEAKRQAVEATKPVTPPTAPQVALGMSSVGCRGIYETIELTGVPKPINHGADCWLSFEVKWGLARFTSNEGSYVEIRAGQSRPLDPNVRYVTWQAVNPEKTAIVHAAFCPQGTQWNGKTPGACRTK